MNSDSNSRSTTAAPARSPAFEEISRRAYELWEQHGRPEGSEQQHWYQAEKELSRGGSVPAASAAPTGAAAPAGRPLPVSTSASSPNAKPKTAIPATGGAGATTAKPPAKGPSAKR